jgi:hypothetical protein
MAERVVDELELIEVEQQDRDGPAIALTAGQSAREAVERELAAAGLRLDGFYTDEGALFGLAAASLA